MSAIAVVFLDLEVVVVVVVTWVACVVVVSVGVVVVTGVAIVDEEGEVQTDIGLCEAASLCIFNL